MIVGLLEGLPTMSKGEVAVFKMKPDMHYGETDCPVSVAESFPKDDKIHFKIKMIDFFKVKVISNDDMGVIKKNLMTSGISALSSDGKILKPHMEEPYFFTFGKSEVPKGLELGIGIVARKEKAVIYVTSEIPMDCPLHIRYRGMLLNEEKTVFYNTKIDDDGQPLEFSSGEGLLISAAYHENMSSQHIMNLLCFCSVVSWQLMYFSTIIQCQKGSKCVFALLLPGELAVVTCPPDYAYDKFPRSCVTLIMFVHKTMRKGKSSLMQDQIMSSMYC
uniref:peptidylprolyl isomerase n=1 Tax=Kalanchoe fedtschenkoi TaxID=63787 RepID=A0A7N0RJJ5_KALFE